MWYAHQLGEIGTPEAVDALIAALDREHQFTRRGAVRGLGIAKDPRAIPYLIRCLTDDDRKTRSEAAEALEQIGAQAQGAAACIEALQRELASDALESRRRRNRVKNVLRKLEA